MSLLFSLANIIFQTLKNEAWNFYLGKISLLSEKKVTLAKITCNLLVHGTETFFKFHAQVLAFLRSS